MPRHLTIAEIAAAHPQIGMLTVLDPRFQVKFACMLEAEKLEMWKAKYATDPKVIDLDPEKLTGDVIEMLRALCAGEFTDYQMAVQMCLLFLLKEGQLDRLPGQLVTFLVTEEDDDEDEDELFWKFIPSPINDPEIMAQIGPCLTTNTPEELVAFEQAKAALGSHSIH